MRNLQGHLFPNASSQKELAEVRTKVIEANLRLSHPLTQFNRMTSQERNYLVGCRLISHDFQWQNNSTALFLDSDRSLSLMVNEEDHVRLQAVLGGWNLDKSQKLASNTLAEFEKNLQFAFAEQYGYLATSPSNSGAGIRLSAMFHLVGLAHAKRLPTVLRGLADQQMEVRGLFGEGSRAIGAYIQISSTKGNTAQFVGACDYLYIEELNSRSRLTDEELKSQYDRTLEFLESNRKLSLADSLRIVSWIRASASRFPELPIDVQAADYLLTRLELEENDPESASEYRLKTIRQAVKG